MNIKGLEYQIDGYGTRHVFIDNSDYVKKCYVFDDNFQDGLGLLCVITTRDRGVFDTRIYPKTTLEDGVKYTVEGYTIDAEGGYELRPDYCLFLYDISQAIEMYIFSKTDNGEEPKQLLEEGDLILNIS